MATILLIVLGMARSCSVQDFGALPDNATDNSLAFRKAAKVCAGGEMLVPPGTFMTGPFNLSSHTILRVEGIISGIQLPEAYPVVTQQPLDEAYRAPWKLNRQRQALVSAYSATNITVIGPGIVDGNGWPWWDNQTSQGCNGRHPPSWQPNATTQPACFVQRPKLVEFVDCERVALLGDSIHAPLTLRNSPFWTFHPTFCHNVRAQHVHFLAPRDHGNTDGVDPDSCDGVHVADVLIGVGDDAVSVKSGRHWRTKEKVPAQNYLFERTTILFRNFAIGSDVSGDIRNITFRDSRIGDDLGSSPWAVKIKTDSQEGGVVDGIYFRNVTIGAITFCGSSRFVFTPPHAPPPGACVAGREKGATMVDLGMGYGMAPTNPGTVRNVVFDGVQGVGPTGNMLGARGLPAAEHIVNLTLRDINLTQGNGVWGCVNVDGLEVDGVEPWNAAKSTCKRAYEKAPEGL